MPSIQSILCGVFLPIALTIAAPLLEREAGNIEVHKVYTSESHPHRVILPSLNPTAVVEPIDDNRHRVPVTPHLNERRNFTKVRREASVANLPSLNPTGVVEPIDRVLEPHLNERRNFTKVRREASVANLPSLNPIGVVEPIDRVLEPHLNERRNFTTHLNERRNFTTHLNERRNFTTHLNERRNFTAHLNERRNFNTHLNERRNATKVRREVSVADLPSLNPTDVVVPIDDSRRQLLVTPHLNERRNFTKVRRQGSVVGKLTYGAMQGLVSGGSSLAADDISDKLTGNDRDHPQREKAEKELKVQ